MKKETIIAIILGLGLGTVVAFFLIFKTQENKIENTKTISNSLKITPKALSKSAISLQPLEIKEPENNALVSEDSINIQGKTLKDSLIIIQSPIKEISLANKEENFSVDFPLAIGENTITVTVYDKNSQVGPQIRELKIYYLNEQ